MKKRQSILVALFTLFFIVGCSKSDDSNGNSTTTVVPLVPSNLTGTIINNQVVLTWTDRSTNETGFKIERMTGTGNWSLNGSVATNILTYTDTGVTMGTTYAYRVYSFNSAGNSLSYSNLFPITIPLTDIDGNIYKTITIGNQVWTKTNLNISRYRNGDVIPEVTDPTAWANLTTGAWCYYRNYSDKEAFYGKLYNWYAINDSRGLAPAGWHVPSDTEWTILLDYLGVDAGHKMRAISTWASPNPATTNSSGFTGHPGGYRTSAGTFLDMYYFGCWWSSSESNTTNAWYTNLNYYGISIHDKLLYNKKYGFSVRLIKD